MTVTKPTVPISKLPTSSKQLKTYQQYVENLPAMIEQLASNEPAMMRLMISINNVVKGQQHEYFR
jgi:hypothetical protein